MNECEIILFGTKTKGAPVSGLRARRLRPARWHFEFSFFFDETMSNCSQNCCIVCPICAASLSHHTLYVGNLVPAHKMYHVFPCWPKKDGRKKKESASPHRFGSRSMTRNRTLYFLHKHYQEKNTSHLQREVFRQMAISSLNVLTNRSYIYNVNFCLCKDDHVFVYVRKRFLDTGQQFFLNSNS